MEGLIHVYCGDGKGKTTAAVGLAVRAAADEKNVLFSQFLKDGTSNELKTLRKLDHVFVLPEKASFGFSFQMTEEQRKHAAQYYNSKLDTIISKISDSSGQIDVLVMDEFMAAYNEQFICCKRAIEFLENKPPQLEIVLTGRNPKEEILKLADYVTEMKKQKHPYDKGIYGRKGIEY